MVFKPETLFYSTDQLELTGRPFHRTRLGSAIHMGYFAEFADEGLVAQFDVRYSLRSPHIALGHLAVHPDWQHEGFQREIIKAIPELPTPIGLHTLARLGKNPKVTYN